MTQYSFDFSAREANNNADPLFVQRWSPRAFTKTTIDPVVMERIINAARWSPSCFNAQPWQIYTSSDATFSEFLDILVEGNQDWAKDTAVLGFMVANLNFEHNGKPNAWAEFDCGSAWMSLTLQARLEGLHTHGMGGFDAERAAKYLDIDSEKQKVVMAFSIGQVVDPATLDSQAKSNETPNSRKNLNAIWHVK